MTFFSRKMDGWMDGKEFRQMKMEVIFRARDGKPWLSFYSCFYSFVLFFFLDFSVRLFRNSGGGRHTHPALSKPHRFFLPQAAMSGECDDGLTAIGIGAPNAGRETLEKEYLLSPNKPAIIYHFFFFLRLLLLLFLDSLTRLTRYDILSPKSLLIGQIPLQVSSILTQPHSHSSHMHAPVRKED
ncbi:hypothetical protein V8C40DRAFT_249933, partial [Trichoderma camerunense]